MEGIVDRLEGAYYVIEVNGKTKDVPISQVAAGVKVGDVVTRVNGIWIADKAATKKRAQHIQKLMDDIWND